jgi:hypothetical protein
MSIRKRSRRKPYPLISDGTKVFAAIALVVVICMLWMAIGYHNTRLSRLEKFHPNALTSVSKDIY